MKYKGRRQSTNIEDRRGGGIGRKVGIGGGIGTIIIVLIVALLGGDPRSILGLLEATQTQQTSQFDGEYQATPQEEELKIFTRVVLADTEDVWNQLFRQYGMNYVEPTLVYFSSKTQSACGLSSAATGPFYCPGDQKIYIDLQFLRQLQRRLGANGDFAVAYILAHEVGHHVQNLLGTLEKVHSKRGRLPERQYNKLNVAVELQADFLAGVWAHHAQKSKQMMERGDLDEAINAAQAVGDDRIQKQSQGYVVPDSFTHGSSKQRMYWFKKGFQTGDINQGNTFSEL